MERQCNYCGAKFSKSYTIRHGSVFCSACQRIAASLVRCASCGKANAVSIGREGKPQCGHCGVGLGFRGRNTDAVATPPKADRAETTQTHPSECPVLIYRSCGAKNRVGFNKYAAICGRCKERLITPQPLTFRVRGITHDNRQAVAATQRVHSRLLLHCRPNEWDAYAVEVLTDSGLQLGFVPREMSRDVTLRLQAGTIKSAFVSAVLGGGCLNYGIEVTASPEAWVPPETSRARMWDDTGPASWSYNRDEDDWESPFFDDAEYDRREQLELLDELLDLGDEIRSGIDDYDACDDRDYY